MLCYNIGAVHHGEKLVSDVRADISKTSKSSIREKGGRQRYRVWSDLQTLLNVLGAK